MLLPKIYKKIDRMFFQAVKVGFYSGTHATSTVQDSIEEEKNQSFYRSRAS